MTGTGRLDGRRVLVVGASSGIGSAIALEVGREGARVAVAARRAAALEKLVAELGDGSLAVPFDVRDDARCASEIESAARALGGLDALVYAVGVSKVGSVLEVPADSWQEIFATNVTGAASAVRAAMPHLESSRGRAVFLSSISADDIPPRRGLGPYMVSKAALNKLVEVLQIEHKRVSFTRVSVGDTAPTEFASDWDLEVASGFIREWGEQGKMFGRAMEPRSVGRHIVDVLAADESIAVTRIVPYHQSDSPSER